MCLCTVCSGPEQSGARHACRCPHQLASVGGEVKVPPAEYRVLGHPQTAPSPQQLAAWRPSSATDDLSAWLELGKSFAAHGAGRHWGRSRTMLLGRAQGPGPCRAARQLTTCLFWTAPKPSRVVVAPQATCPGRCNSDPRDSHVEFLDATPISSKQLSKRDQRRGELACLLVNPWFQVARARVVDARRHGKSLLCCAN